MHFRPINIMIKYFTSHVLFRFFGNLALSHAVILVVFLLYAIRADALQLFTLKFIPGSVARSVARQL